MTEITIQISDIKELDFVPAILYTYCKEKSKESENGVFEVSNFELAEKFNFSYQRAMTAFRELIHRDKIERISRYKTYKYRLCQPQES